MKAVTQMYEFDVPGPLSGSQEEPTQSNINIKSLFLYMKYPFTTTYFPKKLSREVLHSKRIFYCSFNPVKFTVWA